MKATTAAIIASLVGLISLVLAGCDDPQQVTEKPVSMDIYVDSTFSNDQVARECLDDVMAAARFAAASRGFLEFHTFDGDPLRRRGLSASFDEDVPPAVSGTSGEISYLEDEATKLEGAITELIAEPPVVGGSPLIPLLERAARNGTGDDVDKRILICTDGLFTDVTPVGMSAEEAGAAGEGLGDSLDSATVDFIGLDASAPGRGRRIEDTKPLVQALLGAAGMQLGVWNVELGSAWRSSAIATLNRGA